MGCWQSVVCIAIKYLQAEQWKSTELSIAFPDEMEKNNQFHMYHTKGTDYFREKNKYEQAYNINTTH